MITKSKTAPGERPGVFSSPDGRITFVLAEAAPGVRVRRTELRAGAQSEGCALFETIFSSGAAFKHFCGEDPVRFDYPLLYDQVLREFQRLLDGE